MDVCLKLPVVVTARVRSTREGTVFTDVCSHLGGGGYLPSGQGGYLPSQVWMGGVPTFPGRGVPTSQGLDGGGGYLPSQVWMGGVPPLPRVGTPCLG